MTKLSPWIITILVLAATAPGTAQTYTKLATFNGANGELPPYGSLVQGSNGDFYGFSLSGGSNTSNCSDGQGFGCGTIFQLTTAGDLTTFYDFCSQPGCEDGSSAYGGLIKATDGNFYGTTLLGGSTFAGTIFKITPEGSFSTIYSFCSLTNCSDGEEPYAGLIQAKNGNFYGTTSAGGAHGSGTIFEITPAGKLTTLYSFCSLTDCADGYLVWSHLTESSTGKLYGLTQDGGANGAGTVFAITLTGKFTTLHSFTYKDGAFPYGFLLQTSTGGYIGTTSAGGTRNDGTIFEVNSTGQLKTLYNFCGKIYCADGAEPVAGLIQDSSGNFYGTTFAGGTHSRGTIFEITSAGKLTTLYNFCSETNCTDGESPDAGVTLGSDGKYYGTTSGGGDPSCDSPYGCGVVYSLSK